MREVRTDKDGHAFELVRIHCPTCGPGSPERVVGFRGGRHHRYGLGIENQIVQCMRCGLYYPNPYPVPLDAQKLYADPAKYFENFDRDEKIENFREVIRSFEAVRGRPTHSVLDVGSGRGEMLAAAQREGVRDVVGLELSDAMIEASRDELGVKVLGELIEDHAARAGRTYDVVILNAVLEHVRDPDSMIAASRALLAPDGLLYVDIPNEDHLLALVAGGVARAQGRPEVYVLSPTFPPYHVFGFNRRSLRVLLHKHGLEVLRLEMESRLHIPSSNTIKDRMMSVAGAALARMSQPLGLGHNMFVWAQPSAARAQGGQS